MLKPSLIAKTCGKASEEQICKCGNIRVTVFTPCMIRIEADKSGRFNDLPSIAFLNRRQPPCTFSTAQKRGGSVLELTTEKVRFFISANSGKLLAVTFLDSGKTVKNFKKGNLKGTCRTLDQTFGPVPLKDGLLSRNGVSVLNDRDSILLNENGEFTPRTGHGRDDYVFAYGSAYRDCIRDFYKVSGAVPIVPRFALGVWWSRYRQYTQSEYEQLMDRFEAENIPLTVATVDMDWHWTDLNARFGTHYRSNPWSDNPISGGWTGYSWNTDLFPDYRAFLQYLKSKNLHITLNLHPADGVRFFEDAYPEMAKAVGINPQTKQDIPFSCKDPKFWNAYFDVLHKPYEKDGVDFWWIDWQQGKKSDVKGLDPLVALNHYHYLDNAEDGRIPLILSRYGGIGSHRYPLGFSGDTAISWRVLDFQPYFTVNAANCGYTWWSHDIGGHHFGKRDENLYIRWLQFGVFSPVLRLHSTSNDLLGKEPWRYNRPIFEIAKRFLRLRHRLIPYLYTLDYRTHSEGVALCEPMYYLYPEEKEAYTHKNQYMFGENLLVCPITSPNCRELNRGAVEAWLPKGEWTDIFTGQKYSGGKTLTLFRDLASIPVLARAGAILPMSADEGNTAENPQNLELHIFAGYGSFTLFEDSGKTDFESNHVTTAFSVRQTGDTLEFTAEKPVGNADLLPTDRAYTFIFRDVLTCSEVVVTNVEMTVPFASQYPKPQSRAPLVVRVENALQYAKLQIRLFGVKLRQNPLPHDAVVHVLELWQTTTAKKTSAYKPFRRLETAEEIRAEVKRASKLPRSVALALLENLE